MSIENLIFSDPSETEAMAVPFGYEKATTFLTGARPTRSLARVTFAVPVEFVVAQE